MMVRIDATGDRPKVFLGGVEVENLTSLTFVAESPHQTYRVTLEFDVGRNDLEEVIDPATVYGILEP